MALLLLSGRWRSVMRSMAIQRSCRVMLGCALTASSKVSCMALPVASAAWAMRRTVWPPSRVRCSPKGPCASGEKGTPCATNQAMAALLCCAICCAVRSSTMPAPASSVSCTWLAMLSSLPSTPTMPPCAEAVAEISSLRLASTMTGAWSARCKATVRPASPAPTTTTGKSVCLHKVCASEGSVDVFMAEDSSKGSLGAKAREQKSTSKSWL